MRKATQLLGVERVQAMHNDYIGRVDFFWSGKRSRFMIVDCNFLKRQKEDTIVNENESL